MLFLEVVRVEISVQSFFLLILKVIAGLFLDLPLKFLKLPGLAPDLILEFDVPQLSLGLTHPVMLHAYLLPQVPDILIEFKFLLELYLPLLELLGELRPVLLETLQLVQTTHTHLLPP